MTLATHHLSHRQIDVWCPPGYDPTGARRYPVLYLHDGQNVFRPESAFGNSAWEVDQALARLAAAEAVDVPVVAAIWNTAERRAEYMPELPFAGSAEIRARFKAWAGDEAVGSDAYLHFLVETVKPFIDSHYLTDLRPARTLVMGSSMGGLISLYALCRYPQVFGGAGCLSTHWPAGGPALVEAMAALLPEPGQHRLYFDFGTEGLDADYEPLQARMDARLAAVGFRQEWDVLTRKFEGADHNEAAWRARVELPLRFLLGPGNLSLHMRRPTLDDIPQVALPAGYALRRYQPGDEVHWVRIHELADVYNRDYASWFERAFATYRDQLAGRQFYLVAPDGALVGTATAWLDDEDPARPPDPAWGRVHWVAIRPDYQGRGLARPLLSTVLNRLRELGHQGAYLDTSAVRLPAVTLYQRFGFAADPRDEAERDTWERIAWRMVQRV
jgi:predicted alpha/beta superfamily hydrolase/GNAT superfamily N-acetyltransferase